MITLRVIAVLIFVFTLLLTSVYMINFVQTTLSNIEQEMRSVNKNLQFYR